MNYYQYQTVLGLLTICEENDAVIAINVGHYSENKGEKRESELIRRTYKQFVEYLDGIRKVVDFPQPDGPTKTINSLSLTSKLKSSTEYCVAFGYFL